MKLEQEDYQISNISLPKFNKKDLVLIYKNYFKDKLLVQNNLKQI